MNQSTTSAKRTGPRACISRVGRTARSNAVLRTVRRLAQGLQMAYTTVPSNPFTVAGTAAGFLDIRKKSNPSQVVTVAVAASTAVTAVQVVSDGDSLEGYGQGTGNASDTGDFYSTTRWTIALKNLLTSAYQDFRNYGVSGQTVTDMLSDYQTQVLPLLDPASYPTRQILFVGGGVNDIGKNGTTAVQLYALKKQYVQNAKAKGWTVIVATLTRVDDNEGSTVYTKTQMNEQIALYNSMVRNGQADMGYDGLIDWAADELFRFPAQHGQAGNPFHDGIHFIQIGNDRKAAIAKPVFEAAASAGKLTYNPNALLGGVRLPAVWKSNVNIAITGNCWTNTGGGGVQFDAGSAGTQGMGATSATVRGKVGFMARRTGNSTLFGLRAGPPMTYANGIGGLCDVGSQAATIYLEDSSGQGQMSLFINGSQPNFDGTSSSTMAYQDGDILEIENQQTKVLIYKNGIVVATISYVLPDNVHLEAMQARANTAITDAYFMAANPVGV